MGPKRDMFYTAYTRASCQNESKNQLIIFGVEAKGVHDHNSYVDSEGTDYSVPLTKRDGSI